MKVDTPDTVKKILKTFQGADFEVYIVGGAVRDVLMKRHVDDWDFTTNATPDEILKLFPDAFYDNAFGTAMLPNDEVESPYDMTTFRTEHKYSDTRRPDKVEWGKSLDEDLIRRDFTINALALRPADIEKSEFELIDKFEGIKDLDGKLIRTVGVAKERFSEDALRMMRAVRIAAELNFTIEEKTKEAIKENAALIHKIAKERVRDELLKTLSSPNPYQGMVMFREVGLMRQILPELEDSFGVEQKSPGRHHIYDVGTHCMLSLKHCKSTDPIVRFATLIHDVGKPQTFKKDEGGRITFYNHEMVSAKIAKDIARRLKFSNKQTDRFWRLVRFHQFTVDERQTDKAIRRFIRKVGKENIKDMLDLRVGDRLGGGARETSWRLEEFKKRLVEVQKQPFTVHDLKIKGDDVMIELDLKPGPEVGEVLKKLYKEVVDKKVENDKKTLLNKLKDIKN